MKEATKIGDISIKKPAWRLIVDAMISIVNQIRENSLDNMIKGLTIVAIIAIFTTGSVYALIIAPGTGVGDGITFLGGCVTGLSMVIWCNN